MAAAMAFAASTEVRVKNFDESDGFAESPVTCILQDSIGFIWLSTWDGLYRYDGYRLRSFKARPGDNCPLDLNRIDYIRELPGGDILCRVRGEYFTFMRGEGRFAAYKGPRAAHDIAYRPDAETRATVEAMPRYAGIPVRILFKDRQQGVWVHSTKGLDRISFVAKPISNRKAGTAAREEVRALLEDSKGRLWVADKNGYVRLEGRDGTPIGYVGPTGRLSARPTPFCRSCARRWRRAPERCTRCPAASCSMRSTPSRAAPRPAS